jgi:hypothetical protein
LTLARITLFVAAALAVLVAVPVALGARLSGGTQYIGETARGEDVTLRLSGDARRVARLRIHYELKCSNGDSGKTYTVIMNARLRGERHTFRATGRYTGSRDGSTNRFTVEGRVSRRGARGTFSLVNTQDEDVRCRTGKLRWRAVRR